MCQHQHTNGAICGVALEFSTSSLSYHLVNVHGIAKGSLAKRHKLIPKMNSVSSAGMCYHFFVHVLKRLLVSAFVPNAKEQLCLTWACNALAFEVLDDLHFRRSFGLLIPQGMTRLPTGSPMGAPLDRASFYCWGGTITRLIV